MRRPRSALLATLGVLLIGGVAEAVDFPVNPKSTFLRTSQDPDAAAPLIVDLGANGFPPGSLVRIRALGAYAPGAALPETSRRLVCVFSNGSQLSAADQANRVPGAIDASTDVTTDRTANGNLATDIPQDFQCGDVIVAVPQGATHLFVGINDAFYGDNVDLDGDLRLRIEAAGPVRTALEAFDPAKWNSSAEIRVQDVNGRQALLGAARRGGSFNATSTLDLTNQTTVSSVRFTATLFDSHAVGSEFVSTTRASVDGYFYRNPATVDPFCVQNPGDSTCTPGANQAGHVQGHIGYRLDTARSAPFVRLFLSKCLDRFCNTTNDFFGQALPDVVNFFESHQFEATFDFPTRTMTFRFDSQAIPVVVPHANPMPATSPFMQLRARAGNLPADPNASGSILAAFDNVFVNGQPYELFDAQTLPALEILPGSGTFTDGQQQDVVIMVRTAGEAVAPANVRLVFNGQDFSTFIPAAIRGTLAGGGTSFRFPGVVLGTLIPPGQSALVAAEATLPSQTTARGFALWRVVP